MKDVDRLLHEAQELTRLSGLLESIGKIDLEQVEIEKRGPIEAYFTQREKEFLSKRIRSKVKPDKRKPEHRKKMHWKTREKKRREYYKQVSYPKYLRKQVQVVGQDGWFGIMKQGWENWGWTVLITKEEWTSFVEPALHQESCPYRLGGEGWDITEGNCSEAKEQACKGCVVPHTERYNTSNPVIGLKDIMIFDKQQKGRLRKPLFDGAEHHLKMMGYTL